MNGISKMMEYSINNNEFRDFLMGNKNYNIQSRDGFFTDFSAVLYSGIYKYFEFNPNSNINVLFENEIISMFNGDPFEMMCAFEYSWRQVFSEEKKVAPFKLSEKCMLAIRNLLLEKQEILKSYKEYYEFGKSLENGAYQYIENINSYLEHDFGRKIL